MTFSPSSYYLLYTSSDLRAPPGLGEKLWEENGTLIRAILQEGGVRYTANDHDESWVVSFKVQTNEIPKKGLYVVAKGGEAPLEVREVFVYEGFIQIVERL